jgi:hypothetical protein
MFLVKKIVFDISILSVAGWPIGDIKDSVTSEMVGCAAAAGSVSLMVLFYLKAYFQVF